MGHAAAAVQAAIRERPDICLLDIRMPGRGLAAAWEIAGRLPQAKLVMLTVLDEDSDLFAALRAGAAGYLLKTMSLRRLPDALQGACSSEAAIPRTLVARVLEAFHGREPRWRRLAAGSGPQQRLTSREWEVLELLAEGCSRPRIRAGKLICRQVRCECISPPSCTNLRSPIARPPPGCSAALPGMGAQEPERPIGSRPLTRRRRAARP